MNESCIKIEIAAEKTKTNMNIIVGTKRCFYININLPSPVNTKR